MLFEKRYKSKLGYSVGEYDEIDSYGVDHSGFTTRDEVAYQTARNDRENDLIENYNKRGITDNYPQYGRNFWGSSPENNYGFGSSNIKQNIENVTKRLNNSGWNGGLNDEQGMVNYNYTLNTESIVGQPNNSGGNDDSIVQGITALNPINTGYQIGQKIGELAADTKLAYDYWQKMNQTGNQLVKTFGSGQGADIDNYYHPLLQCELAKISPQSRDNGIALGYAKEYLMDYPKKRFLKRQSHNEIMKDSRKDLKNNLYGSNLGYNNPNTSCEDLLDDRRTPNMRRLGIR